MCTKRTRSQQKWLMKNYVSIQQRTLFRALMVVEGCEWRWSGEELESLVRYHLSSWVLPTHLGKCWIIAGRWDTALGRCREACSSHTLQPGENTHLFYRWINNHFLEQTQSSSSMQCYYLGFHHKQKNVPVTTNGKISGLDVSKTTPCCSQTLGLSWLWAQALFVQHLAQWELASGWKPPCVATEKYTYGLGYPSCSFLIIKGRWKHYKYF